MKAIVQTGYGAPDVLRLQDIGEPAVGDDQVLVRVRAASVHPDVWHVLRGRPYVLRLMGAGLRRPTNRVPGTDVAGHVEAVGGTVTRFAPGDEVFGETVKGYQWRNGGAYAEYAAVPEAALARKPANVTFEQAAAVPTSGLIALSGLRQGRLQAGQRVLVNGAGGGVGTIAVQLAKAFGAQVTGVDGAEKLAAVRSLGADHVIDYAAEDFTKGRARYDLILDVPGNHRFSDCRRVLTAAGTYVLIGHDRYGTAGRRLLGSLPRFAGLMLRSPFVRQLPGVRFSMPDKAESMAVLSELLEAGKLTPLVDTTYPLSQVPEAIGHLEAGHVLGKLVILV